MAFGVKKLQISCVVEDEKVGTDFLEESITEFEDYVSCQPLFDQFKHGRHFTGEICVFTPFSGYGTQREHRHRTLGPFRLGLAPFVGEEVTVHSTGKKNFN